MNVSCPRVEKTYATVPTVQKDLFFKFLGEIASRLLFVGVFFYLGRVFQPAQFGTFSLAISLATVLAVIFIDPGLNLALVQVLIRRPNTASRDAGVVLLAKLILFVPVIAALMVANYASRRLFLPAPILIAAGLYACLNGLLDYFSAVTNAFHNMHIEAVIKISNRLLIVGSMILALKFGGALATLWAMCIATLMSCVMAWLLVTRYCASVFPSWNWGSLREVVRLGLPIAGTFICGTVYLKWDLVMLSLFNIAPIQIGWYAAAFKILEALSAIPGILGAALFPIMVRLYKNDISAFVRIVKLSSKLLLLCSIPLAIGLCVFSEPIVYRVYGVTYSQAGSVLRILIWSIVPMFLYFFFMSVNVAMGFARFNMWTGFASLIVSFVTNVLLIPRFGYIGAAWAALLANSTFAALAVWKVTGTFPEIKMADMSGRIALSGAMMFLTLALIPSAATIRLLPAGLVFVLGLFAFRGIEAKDFALASRVFAGAARDLNA